MFAQLANHRRKMQNTLLVVFEAAQEAEFLDKVDYIWNLVREEAIAADAEKSQ